MNLVCANFIVVSCNIIHIELSLILSTRSTTILD